MPGLRIHRASLPPEKIESSHDGLARLHANGRRLGRDDTECRSRNAPDVRLRLSVASAGLQREVLNWAFLGRKGEPAAAAQHARDVAEQLLEHADVDENVGGNRGVEARRGCLPEPGVYLARVQL